MTSSNERVKADNYTLRAQKSMEVDASGQAISGSIVKYDDDGDYTYIGRAIPGSATSSAVWSIKRITDATGDILWADSSTDALMIWDNRKDNTYTYG